MTDGLSLGIFINMQGGASNQGLAAPDGAGRLSRFFAGLALLIAAPGCAANSYMGIPLARGATNTGLQSGVAEPSLQLLAARARVGDKQAQLDLGIRFEEGRGVARDLRRAQALYGAAAKDGGGARMMFVPQRNGSVSAVPVASGPQVTGLPEAMAALAQLGKTERSSVPSLSPAVAPRKRSRAPDAVDDHPDAIFHGSIGTVFLTIVKIEVFSEKCLVRGKSNGEAREVYAQRGWNCLLVSQLPAACTSYPDAILRSVRFVRFHPNFVALRRLMPRVIEQCLGKYKGTVETAYNGVEHAGMLDISLEGLGHATRRQKELVDAFRESSLAHSSQPVLPGYVFSQEMCFSLVNGTEIGGPDFWLLYCNDSNDTFRIRADRADMIDKIIRERGFDARAN